MTQAAATADRHDPALGGGARPPTGRRPRRQGPERRPEPDGPRAMGRRDFVNLFGDNRLAFPFRDDTAGGQAGCRAKFAIL
jgi:hypothetical protein